LKWDGVQWSSVGGGVDAGYYGPGVVYTLVVFDDGTGPALYVGGDFTLAGGLAANHIARWNGAAWSTLGSGVDGYAVEAMAAYSGSGAPQLYVGGVFTSAGGVHVHALARWNGASWSAVPGDIQQQVYALTEFDDGNGAALYAGGIGGTVGGQSVAGVMRLDGTSWWALGWGLNDQVFALTPYDSGLGGGVDLYAAGLFDTAGGVIPSIKFARWHGCDHPIDPICLGDGTVAPCPCANEGAAGHGCDNSIASGGARLTYSGMTNPDSLVLSSSGELPTSLSIFMQGNALTQTVTFFGDGIRCVGGTLLRLYAKAASGGVVSAPQPGDPSISARSAALGDPIATGTVRYYQVYYRDASSSFCPPPSGSTFNASNGLRVVW